MKALRELKNRIRKTEKEIQGAYAEKWDLEERLFDTLDSLSEEAYKQLKASIEQLALEIKNLIRKRALLLMKYKEVSKKKKTG